MKTLKLLNYAADQWVAGDGALAEVRSAVTGEVIAETGSSGLDFKAMLDHARRTGGPALRRMTFHERAWMLKDLATAVMARKEELYELSYATGATRGDGWIDIEGGAGTLFSFSSKGRRELPNDTIYVEGDAEKISKTGTFTGRHVCVPLEGVAVQIIGLLRPGGHLVLNVADVENDGDITPMARDVAERVARHAELVREITICWDQQPDGVVNDRCLVFSSPTSS